MAYGYLLAAGGSLLGSYLSAQGSKNAAQTQSDAQMQAAAIQQQMFNRIVAQEQPFLQTGYNATNALNSLMGFGNTNYGAAPMGNEGGYGQAAPPPSYASPGAPSGMGPSGYGAVSGPGMTSVANAGGYGTGNYDQVGAGDYGPTTFNMGGQTISGSQGPSLGQIVSGIAGGLAGGPLGGIAAYGASKMGGNTFVLPNGQVVKGAQNVEPTSVTMPKSSITTPGQIINPQTGGAYGQAYYSTPVGEEAAFHNAISLAQLAGGQQSNIIGSARAGLRQKAKYGGVVGDSTLPASVTVGEDGPEQVHMMPGSMAYVEPNPGTMEKMKKGHQLPRSGGNGLPGRLLGGLIGAPVSRTQSPGIAGWRPTGQTGAFTGGAASGPTIGNPSNLGLPHNSAVPAQNAIGGNYGVPGVSPNPMQNGGLTVGSASNNPGYLMQTYTPQAFNPTQADLTNYPGYQFQLQQGNLAIQNSAATKYGALSGAGLKDMENYDQGLAASNYGNYFNQYQQQQGNMFNMFQTQQNNIFNRLQQLSALGQNAAGNLGSQGANLGTGIAQANAAAGGSLAGGQLGAANAYAGAANTIPLYMLLANQGGG